MVLAPCQSRRAIGGPGFLIQLVGKFMNYHVLTIVRAGDTRKCVLPRQDDLPIQPGLVRAMGADTGARMHPTPLDCRPSMRFRGNSRPYFSIFAYSQFVVPSLCIKSPSVEIPLRVKITRSRRPRSNSAIERLPIDTTFGILIN